MNWPAASSRHRTAAHLALAACWLLAAPVARAQEYTGYEVWNMEVLSHIGGGPGYAIHVDGHYAYLCHGWSVSIIDVRDPAQPAVVARLPYYAYDIDVSNGMAYIADFYNGLRIVDVREPWSPRLLYTYPTGRRYLFDVEVSGGLAYCRHRDGLSDQDLIILDVSDPSSPTLVGSHRDYGYYHAWIRVADGFVHYPGTVIDARDPRRPVILSTYAAPGYGIDLSGNLAYTFGKGELHIFDMSNPSSPTFVASAKTTGMDYRDDLHVSGDFAFVTGVGRGLTIFDVADPTSPAVRGTYDLPWMGEHIRRVFAFGNTAYLAWERGLLIFDVSNPDAPRLLATHAEPGGCQGVALSNGLAYLTSRQTFQILDARNPYLPRPLGICELERSPDPGQPAIADGFVYVGDSVFGLQAIDVRNPSSPTVVASCQSPVRVYQGLFVQDKFLFVNGMRSILQAFDITDPTSPVLRHTYGDTAIVGPFFLADNRLYNAGAELRIFDMTDLSSPSLLGSHPIPDGGYTISVSEGLASIVYDRLHVFNVRDPSAPVLLGSVDVRDQSSNVTTAANLVFVFAAYIQVFDISDPTSPVLRGSFQSTVSGSQGQDRVTGVVADDEFIYVSSYLGGLWILRYTGPRSPWSSARSRWTLYD